MTFSYKICFFKKNLIKLKIHTVDYRKFKALFSQNELSGSSGRSLARFQ